ncbi:MAG TPA: DUF4846 domain-containing protein [Armatimonadota bacterium]|nr:DUF4846 domain-containing protein [Armatimonadota bacterium]
MEPGKPDAEARPQPLDPNVPGPGRRVLRIALAAAVVAVGACAFFQWAGVAPREVARTFPNGYPRRSADYAWHRHTRSYTPIASRIGIPAGFHEVPVEPGSWPEWLRFLPLMPAHSPIRGADGRPLGWPGIPAPPGVVDMDVRRNQECADTILRLRAEYLRWAGHDDRLAFSLAGGGTISWADWRRGMRPVPVGGRVRMVRMAGPSESRQSFEAFLDAVFNWCNTDSLSGDGIPATPEDLRIGDFVSRPGAGARGHAMMIVDLAVDADGNRRALILQGAMPAQSAHLLRASTGSAWIPIYPAPCFSVPGWREFTWDLLRRFDP